MRFFEKWFYFFVVCLPILWIGGAFAQDMNFIIEQAATYTATFLIPLIVKYPAISWILLFMGTCRAIFKPLFSLLQSIAPTTKTNADDKAVALVFKLMQNKFVAWFFDYLFSVKTKIEKK